MKVELVSYSNPVIEEAENMTELVAYCARVSNPKNQGNKETSEKLINYLIQHSHWSPLEMVNVCLGIETTRDIARQILRHRSFTFQEFSQRYADPTAELNFVTREARFQDDKNRQNSIELDLTDPTHIKLAREWEWQQQQIIKAARQAYNWAISYGIAKEQARCVLPEGNTVSRLYVNGTLRSWIHFIALRSKEETQKEHREIAIACAKVIAEVFPMSTNFVK